jgi:hypothetical protein
VTIALEHIRPDDWAGVNRAVDALRGLVLDTGGVSLGIRVGVSTVTWPGASTFSTAKSISHGLGRAPTIAAAFDASGGTLAHIPVFVIPTASMTSTVFSVTAETGDLSSPAAAVVRNFYWVAIG